MSQLSQRYEKLFDHAIQLEQKKQWNPAIRKWMELNKLYPDDFEAQMRLISCLLRRRRFSDAQRYLSELAESSHAHDESKKLRICHCAARLSSAQYGHANSLNQWEEVYKHSPTNPSFASHYGQALLEANSDEPAFEIFSELSRRNVNTTAVHESLARLALRRNPESVVDAINHLQQALPLSHGPTKTGDLLYFLNELKIYSAGPQDRKQVIEELYSAACSHLGFPELSSFIIKYRLYGIHPEVLLADVHDHSWSRNGSQQLTTIIKSALEKQQPFSLVRLGDGEGKVLSGLNRNLLGATASENNTPQNLSPQAYSKMRDELCDAIQNSDVLGVPPPQLLLRSPHWKTIVDNLPFSPLDNVFEGRVVTTWHCHNHLYWSSGLHELITSQQFIGYISAHNLDEYFEGLGIAKVVGFQIPGQRGNKLNTLQEPHYPYYYDRIHQELQVPFPGAVYLVGAGVLGKTYCNLIKQRGGIAIDVGAVFDHASGHGSTRITYRTAGNRGFLPLGAH